MISLRELQRFISLLRPINIHTRTPRASVKSTPKNRRGDIHSSLSITPSASARRIARRAEQRVADPNNLNSDISHLDVPGSSAPHLSAQEAPTDEPDEIRAIWGTTVNLAETMKMFRDFVRGFKPKYRVSYDRDQGLKTRVFSSPEEGEVLLYEIYLRRMRQTGESNLNLDVGNLLAYPPSKKLHAQLVKYPQEVIPAMDQVLKDMMLEVAEADQQADLEGMQGAEGDEEINEILGRIYKVRPFGLVSINMRNLNPSGTCSNFQYCGYTLIQLNRYGQARMHQGSRYPCHARHPRYESRLLPLPDLFSHRPSRNRPGQD